MELDIAELETYRPSLTGHCYRMLGSAADAEDAVQETIVRAWRNLDRFEGRSQIRTWLHRIATNVCLDTLSDDSRRMRPFEVGSPADSFDHPMETLDRTHWLEPVPDARAIPSDASPEELAVLRQSIRLAFVAALQHLPPRQRATLLLIDVLGWSASDAAECLDSTLAATNSALQRARATIGSRNLDQSRREPLSDRQAALLERYVASFQSFDLDALVSLLREDATFSMPPYTLWLRGPEQVRNFMLGPGSGCRGSRLVRVDASDSPAFAQYRVGAEEGTYEAWAIIVLELADDRVAGWNTFLDTERLFPLFGLPLQLSA